MFVNIIKYGRIIKQAKTFYPNITSYIIYFEEEIFKHRGVN